MEEGWLESYYHGSFLSRRTKHLTVGIGLTLVPTAVTLGEAT